MVTWHALDALSHQLELCGIDADTRVVAILDEPRSTDHIDLVRAAVARCGAQALDVRPMADTSPNTNPLIVALAEATDVVLTSSESYAVALQDYGPAILLLPAEIDPDSFPPHANLRRRVVAVVDAMSHAELLQVTDGYGTALDIELGNATIDFDHGLVDDSHRYGTYPSGWVAAEPAPESIDGSLVLMPGDGNVTADCHVSSPVTLDIVDGLITTIHGESPDADIIRAVLEYAGDPGAYGLARVSIGLNPGRGQVTAFGRQLLEPQLSRLAAGTITFSFGPRPAISAGLISSSVLTLALPGRSWLVDRLPLATNGALQGDIAPDVYELG